MYLFPKRTDIELYFLCYNYDYVLHISLDVRVQRMFLELIINNRTKFLLITDHAISFVQLTLTKNL